MPDSRRLLEDLRLDSMWIDATGTSSQEWLATEARRALNSGWQSIDLAYVDSNHTYAQVQAELEGVLPLLSPRAAIVVDNCYTVAYEVDPGLDWIKGESEEGIIKGGEYGAILDFITAHPEWHAEWTAWPHDYMYLVRIPGYESESDDRLP